MDDGVGRPLTHHQLAAQPAPPNVVDSSNSRTSESDEDGFSDASSDLVELCDSDFPTYFVTLDGRLFHSHGSLQFYPLPADGHEQKRLRRLHRVLRALVPSTCPALQLVDEVLACSRGSALDLCTGTGKWVTEMAGKFKHIKFIGVDIVPIQTRHPPNNVQFEIANVLERFRYQDNSFKLVHARCTAFGVTYQRYPRMLREIARVLCSGGLFISGEFRNWPVFPSSPADACDPRIYCPAFCRFLELVAHVLAQRDVRSDLAFIVPELVQATESFTGIGSKTYLLPVGGWSEDRRLKDIGEKARVIFIGFVQAMQSFLERYGLVRGAELAGLIAGSVHELQHVNGMAMHYDVVWARKR